MSQVPPFERQPEEGLQLYMQELLKQIILSNAYKQLIRVHTNSNN